MTVKWVQLRKKGDGGCNNSYGGGHCSDCSHGCGHCHPVPSGVKSLSSAM
jgi:hypothetical protein